MKQHTIEIAEIPAWWKRSETGGYLVEAIKGQEGKTVFVKARSGDKTLVQLDHELSSDSRFGTYSYTKVEEEKPTIENHNCCADYDFCHICGRDGSEDARL